MTDAEAGLRPGIEKHALQREEIRARLDNSCGQGPGGLQPCLDAETASGWAAASAAFPAAAAASAAAAGAASPAREATPAAVLVGLLDEPGGPWVILTRRTAHLADHPGEISLPGGRVESEDDGPVAAALREAWEEIGLPLARVDVLGCLPLYRTVSDYCVHPIVAWVDSPLESVPDEHEVAEVFLVPLDFILDPANHGRGSLVRDGVRRDYYVLDYEERRIWGATAGILVSLARALGVR